MSSDLFRNKGNTRRRRRRRRRRRSRRRRRNLSRFKLDVVETAVPRSKTHQQTTPGSLKTFPSGVPHPPPLFFFFFFFSFLCLFYFTFWMLARVLTRPSFGCHWSSFQMIYYHLLPPPRAPILLIIVPKVLTWSICSVINKSNEWEK